jgi:sarcosine oxidase subunit gamma
MSDISAASPNPERFIRRSQLYRWHLKNNAEFDTADGSVTHYADLAKESESVGQLGLADLSNLPRTGFKGPGAAEWIVGNGVALPEAPNLAHAHSDSSLLVRLSHQELLVLSDLKRQSMLADTLPQNWSVEASQGVSLLPRADSHCWFALTGIHAAEMFSKVCAVDLRPGKFAQGEVAQTSIARVNAIIVRNDLGPTLCFYILSDVSSAEFLWLSLLDAMLEFEGAAVGTAALKACKDAAIV